MGHRRGVCVPCSVSAVCPFRATFVVDVYSQWPPGSREKFFRARRRLWHPVPAHVQNKGAEEGVSQRFLLLVRPFKLRTYYYQRPIETMSKQNAAIEAGLEGRVNEMFAVDDIAVHPKRQGLGYGSALMAAARAKVRGIADFPVCHDRILTFPSTKADALGLFSWLSSSNITNTAFYEHCGFKTVQEFAIGDNNPTWTEPPIILKIVRTPFLQGRSVQQDLQ